MKVPVNWSLDIRTLRVFILPLLTTRVVVSLNFLRSVFIAVNQQDPDLQRPFHCVPFLRDHPPISIPHNIYFLNDEVLLISYFGLLGIQYAFTCTCSEHSESITFQSAHRTSHPYERLWKIKPRQDRWM
jgi:hypothetical protein